MPIIFQIKTNFQQHFNPPPSFKMANHLSTDAVPSNPQNFQKYLKTIHDGLSSTDVSKMCFLCKDLIPSSDLEKVKRGLQLFTHFQRQMLISAHDVSFLLELLEAISRKDLVKTAWGWPAAYQAVGRQFQISRFRLVLLKIILKASKLLVG